MTLKEINRQIESLQKLYIDCANNLETDEYFYIETRLQTLYEMQANCKENK